MSVTNLPNFFIYSLIFQSCLKFLAGTAKTHVVFQVQVCHKTYQQLRGLALKPRERDTHDYYCTVVLQIKENIKNPMGM